MSISALCRLIAFGLSSDGGLAMFEGRFTERLAGFTWFWVILLCLIGAGARIAPLMNQDGRMLQQWPTEDGYLMLTIARNLSLGLGMTTADGTIPTNGTQPLMTFVYASVFEIVGSKKAAGVLLIQFLELVLISIAAYLLYLLGRAVLYRSDSPLVPASAAAVWYASPHTVSHSMNCLETGGYVLSILGCLLLFMRWKGYEGTAWSFGRCMLFGVLLGITFLVRIDAAFFIFAILSCRILTGFAANAASFWRLISEAAIAGLVSFLIGLPWLVYNHMYFGSIMPISGMAQQKLKTEFLDDFIKIAVSVCEYILVVFPIPASVESTVLAKGLCVLLTISYFIALAVVAFNGNNPIRCLIIVMVMLTLGWLGYYGLRSIATWFFSRYFFPISPLFALMTIAIGIRMARNLLPGGWRNALTAPLLLGVLLIVAGLHIRTYSTGNQHQHFQVVHWVRDHVPQQTWVGAVQTGTLGFFHDRTINLDGKVNPEALYAKQHNGILQYVVDSNIDYVVDWVGVGKTWHRSPLSEFFDLVVVDEAKNLSVLARKTPTGE
jgi:hypothetical protein